MVSYLTKAKRLDTDHSHLRYPSVHQNEHPPCDGEIHHHPNVRGWDEHIQTTNVVHVCSIIHLGKMI
jgi:hypothetical protein